VQRVRIALIVVLFLACSVMGGAVRLVFVRSSQTSAADQHQLEAACQFYGLDLKVVGNGRAEMASALGVMTEMDTIAVALDAHALESIDRRQLLQFLKRGNDAPAPLLILGLTSAEEPSLNRWSGGALRGVSRLAGSNSVNYMVGRVAGITGELSGVSLPYRGRAPYFFRLGAGVPVQQIGTIRQGDAALPTLIETKLARQSIFFAAASTFERRDDRGLPSPDILDAFTANVSAMVFVRYAAGDQGWHTPQHFANLTIDDPWLREPYGDLNYAGLLAEMKAHNFHTTIAFIPWNYARSTAEVTRIFRNNPDRYSIAIHGDNHDHKEFEGFDSRPVAVQKAKLDQALARMNAFQTLTKIHFDRVFVFPHSIGEGAILGKLKEDNYIATVNSTNVPMGCKRPQDPLFDLRPVTTAYYDFPSILRYPAELNDRRALIAVNEFLGNPLFFYVHQDFFARDIDAFDPVADEVNSIEPGTEWRSLGYIAAHLYLMRRIAGSEYDVFSSSSSVDLQNNSPSPVFYKVTKRESSPLLIQAVLVNSRPVLYTVESGFLHFTVTAQAGSDAHAVVLYRNSTNLAAIDIRHRSARIYLLRMASDVRDIWMSHFTLGEAIVAWYYKNDEMPLRLISRVSIPAATIGVAMWFLLILLRRRKLSGRTR
jgi:hypothetical protein